MPLTRPARLTALALLAACCAAFAPAPVYRQPKAKPDRRTDEEKLQGAWERVSQSVNGLAAKSVPGRDTALFVGRSLSLLSRGKVTKAWSFSIDPAASPKRLDLLVGESEPVRGVAFRGIYRLEGGRLTIAFGDGPMASRPVDFEGRRGLQVFVYRRAKRGK